MTFSNMTLNFLDSMGWSIIKLYTYILISNYIKMYKVQNDSIIYLFLSIKFKRLIIIWLQPKNGVKEKGVIFFIKNVILLFIKNFVTTFIKKDVHMTINI